MRCNKMAAFTSGGVFSSWLLCCLLFFCTDYSSADSTLDSTCARVAEYYGKHVGLADTVPSQPILDAGLGVCAHTLKHTEDQSCCNPDMEEHFLRHSVMYLQEHIQMNNKELKSGITRSLDLYQEHLKSSSNEAREQTSTTLQNLFQIPKHAFGKTLDIFFAELNAFVKGEELSLESIVNTFFNNLFPHVFEHVLSDPKRVRELGPDFKQCLHESYRDIKPFARVPADMIKNMRSAFDRARIFSESLRVMIGVIDMTETLDMDSHCKRAVARLQYCSMCGSVFEARPCRGLCLNVMRGCLVYAKELSPAWDHLVSAFQNLELSRTPLRRKGALEVMHDFEGEVKAALWGVMDRMDRIYTQVTKRCQNSSSPDSGMGRKHFSTAELGRTSSQRGSSPGHRLDTIREDIRQLVLQLQDSKGFLQRIADNLCRHEIMYDQVMTSETCWNGSAVGRYSHSVPELNIISQTKNNREVQITLRSKPQILEQKEILEHMRTRLSALFNDELMQQDDGYFGAATLDMGSGYSRIADVTINDDEDYNIGAVSGSGSGDGPEEGEGETDPMTPTKKTPSEKPGCRGGDCDDKTGGQDKPRDGGSNLSWSLASVSLALLTALWACL